MQGTWTRCRRPTTWHFCLRNKAIWTRRLGLGEGGVGEGVGGFGQHTNYIGRWISDLFGPKGQRRPSWRMRAEP